MSYFGIGYPRIQIRTSVGAVQADHHLPYPTRRAFIPELVADPQTNPVLKEHLERRFGLHLRFEFYWAILDNAELAKLINIANETTNELWIYPHNEITALVYQVFVEAVELPLLVGKSAYQGFDLILKTVNLQTQVVDIY